MKKRKEKCATTTKVETRHPPPPKKTSKTKKKETSPKRGRNRPIQCVLAVFLSVCSCSFRCVTLRRPDQKSNKQRIHAERRRATNEDKKPIDRDAWDKKQKANRCCFYTTGPALMTSSVASLSYFLKFSTNNVPSLRTSCLKLSAPAVHALAGLSSSEGTLGQVLGT